ncbi:hypothetical protein F8388_008496 [Cannabis sativa]|uniref:Uncharacterized protein n=1 Tax=Cannabis sativa TaxID=3483 RepID=A0A7J6EHT0_CANSA|nr:hypothetical protein F8388_008496 [Cannabis sativa]KAF4404410.1 hypothetical protein G4B88_014866 [Cannabis sativa]
MIFPSSDHDPERHFRFPEMGSLQLFRCWTRFPPLEVGAGSDSLRHLHKQLVRDTKGNSNYPDSCDKKAQKTKYITSYNYCLAGLKNRRHVSSILL